MDYHVLDVDLDYIKLYLHYLVKWTLLAAMIGIPCGMLGALFYNGIAYVTELRAEYPWILYLLPLAGVFIVFWYRFLKVEGAGTDTVVECARNGSCVKLLFIPAIFVGTILTHLCGGSAGREGAALQIGGGIGSNVGRLFRLSKEDQKIATMAGMSAFFAALFGTPVTATVFVAFFLEVGSVYPVMFFPSFIASISAYVIAKQFGMVPFGFSIEIPEQTPELFLRVMALAALGALVSALFVKTLHLTGRLYKRYIPNEYLRVIAGAVIIIALTTILGTTDYNGAGGAVIHRAVLEGETVPYAFLLKILFTALTLEAGFKGGEIVPTFFIGATFGAFVGPLLGIPASFAAASGMGGVFGGATNTLVAPVFLAIEAFGSEGMIYFVIACIMSFMLSGYNGLYSKQTIRFSKLRARLVNVQTNHRPRHLKHVIYDESGVHEAKRQ